MKKIKVLLFMFLFLFPFDFVSANGESVSISCSNQAEVGGIISCTVIGNAGDREVSSVNAKFSISENLELVSFDSDSIWIGDADSGSIDLYTDDNKIGIFNIGVFRLKVKNNDISNVSLLLYDIFFSDKDFNEFSVNNSSSTIKIVSSNNYLSSLTLSSGNISPTFDKNTSNYTAVVSSDKVNISAVCEDNNAIVDGTGVKNLQYGDNTFIITVTSQSAVSREYKIVITRPNNETKNESMDEDNKILSDDNKLKSLEVVGYELGFNEEKLEYFIDVDKDVSFLEVKASANDSKAKIVISGNDKIVSGSNKILVLVTSESGKTLEYVINVNKEIINQTLLKELVIEGYNIDFKQDQFGYELDIEQEDTLNISAVAISDEANVEILNNYKLKNNSIIEIRVFYEDSESLYTIRITKEENNSENDYKIIVLTIIGVLLIMVSLGGLTIKIVRIIKSRKQENV